MIDVQAHLGTIDGSERRLDALRSYADSGQAEMILVSHSDHTPEGGELDETEANLACLKACRDNDRLRPLYWVRPGLVDSNPQVFAGALSSEPFVGAVFSPAEHGYALDDSARLAPYLGVLDQLKRPALVRIGRETSVGGRQLLTFAQKWPGVPIILCGGLANIRQHDLHDTATNAARRNDADIYLTTSNVSAADVAAAVAGSGHERLIFGSDACCRGAEHAEFVAAQLKTLQERLATTAFQQITQDTAHRIFAADGD